MALAAEVERNSPVAEAAILNSMCCPPRDPFKMSAQEPLLKSEKGEGDERRQRPKENSFRQWLLSCEEDLCPQNLNLNCRVEQK